MIGGMASATISLLMGSIFDPLTERTTGIDSSQGASNGAAGPYYEIG